MKLSDAISQLQELQQEYGQDATVAVLYYTVEDIKKVCDTQNINFDWYSDRTDTILHKLEDDLDAISMEFLRDVLNADVFERMEERNEN